MKILLYGDHHNDESGIGRELRLLIPHLSKQNEVRQVALNCAVVNQSLVPTYATLGKSENFWGLNILEDAIAEFQPDIVFSNRDTYALSILAPVIKKQRAWKLKWVHWNNLEGNPLSREFTRATLDVHSNLAHSSFTMNTIKAAQKRHFDVDERIELVYPPIDSNVFKNLSSRSALKEKYGLQNRFIILCVAKNQIRKNIPCLMEAVALLKQKCPDILLMLHCLPTKKINGKLGGFNLQEIVEELDISKHIASMGSESALPESVMNELYNLCDAHCLPSMGEGFGLPIAEAMLAGTPNIATDFSSLSELLNEGRGLLVKPAAYLRADGFSRQALLSAQDLADAILQLYNSELTRQQIVEKASLICHLFNASDISSRILKIFSDLLNYDTPRISAQLEAAEKR